MPLRTRSNLDPVHVVVASDAKPSSRSDIRRPKGAVWFCRNQLTLSDQWRSPPKMREAMIVVAIWPQHHELSSTKNAGDP
jgi:hypothetical protein